MGLEHRTWERTGQFLPQERQGLGRAQGEMHGGVSLAETPTAVARGFPSDGGTGSDGPEPLDGYRVFRKA